MDEDFEQLLYSLLNSYGVQDGVMSNSDKKSIVHILSPKQLESVREGLHWYMRVIPMLTLIPSSKIVHIIESERRLAQEWLSRSWQYKRYHMPNVSQLPLDDDQVSHESALSSNESSFDSYWETIISHCSNTYSPSLAMLDVIFYLFITFATSTGNFSDPNALRIDAQKKLCQFIQTVFEPSISATITPSESNASRYPITTHFSLFMRNIIQRSPGSLSLLNLTMLEQHVLQGIMNASDDEKKLAAISLYQSIKELQGAKM